MCISKMNVFPGCIELRQKLMMIELGFTEGRNEIITKKTIILSLHLLREVRRLLPQIA